MPTIDISKISPEITDKYSIVSNAFSLPAKTDPKDTITTEIGDTKQTDFYPQVKIMRWDNEVNASFRLVNDEKTPVVSTNGEKIVWSGDKIDCNFYDVKEEEGGYEFEVILKEKPLTNKIEFTINTKGLDFFYQPELTQEEIDEGCVRPDNIVGSYVVYHQTKGGMNDINGKDYKTGQFGFLYRPKIIDALGKEIWGILKIEKDILSIEIPQKFLDNAIYPVVVDPTFGYTTVGGSSGAVAYDTIRSLPYTTTEAGSVYEVRFYASGSTTDARGILTNSDKTTLTYGAKVDIAASAAWNILPVTVATLANATEYRIAVWLGIANPTYYYNAGATLYRDNIAFHATNAPPNPIVDDATTADRKISMYASYTRTTPGTYTDTYTVSDTWVAPASVTSATVECWGGGAGGGGQGGGGGGAYVRSVVDVTAGNSYAVVVAAGVAKSTNGIDSSFDGATVVADGGYAPAGDTGGAGGTVAASTGDVEYKGGDGGDGEGSNGGGGGGGGGKDGAGVDGVDASGSGNGGAGDNGSGGAGGAGATGGNGVENVLGGGGGGGFDGLGNGGNGGAPGGAGGGGLNNLLQTGARGQVLITYTIPAGGGTTQDWRDIYQIISNKSQIISENRII